MKKILFFAVCVASLVSCKEVTKAPIELYCEHEVVRVYDDPNAEMDTLSYAAGMDLGLVASLRFGDFDIDIEEVIPVMSRELKSAESDEDVLKQWNEYITEFNNKRVRPYMMAKNTPTDRPDTLTIPELYDETYTKEKMTEYIGVMSANQLRMQRIPANLTWVFKAIRDAAQVGDMSEIDTYMSITEEEFMNIMRNYSTKVYPKNNLEMANAWLEKVASKENVRKLNDETDVYYRINDAGKGTKPVNATDTIAVKYAVYSRTGKVIESNDTFIKRLEDQKKHYESHPMLPDSIRAKYAKQIDEEIAKSDVLEFQLNRFLATDIQEALKLIGEGGSITIWGNGASAFGFRAGQIVPANEAVVVNIELVDVITVDPLSIQPKAVPMNGPGQTVRPNTTKGTPIKVAPKKVVPKK